MLQHIYRDAPFFFKGTEVINFETIFPEEHNNPWNAFLKSESSQCYYSDITNYLALETKNNQQYYPADSDIFNAYTSDFSSIKVVIIGQDPYHGPHQAHGLAFSVPSGVKIPPSLKNIFKELETDLGINTPQHGNLTPWSKQGVFLLNSALTVRANTPLSHANIGWEKLTRSSIAYISSHLSHVVFMLWGKHAQAYQSIIDEKKHYILTSSHPSPLSAYRGFLGCKHFSKCNDYLKSHHRTPIHWELV